MVAESHLPDRWRAYAHRLLTACSATYAGEAAPERISAFVDTREAELLLLAREPAAAAEHLAMWSHRVAIDLLAFLGVDSDVWGRSVRPPRIAVRDGEVELTVREFMVFQALSNHRGQVLSRAQLRGLAWPDDAHVKENVVTVYVGYLRRKLGEGAIETVRGTGYRMR